MIYNRSETQVRINTSGIPVCVTSLLSLPVIIKPHLSHVIYGDLTYMLSVIKNSIYVPEMSSSLVLSLVTEKLQG
jgi:hypothetical protein